MVTQTKTIKIKQVKSSSGRSKDQLATIKGLGLKMNKEVVREDTLAVRGMVNKVKHLLEIL